MVKGAIGECQVRAFGSFATGLYLPDGDIDVAVLIETDNVKQVYDIIHATIRSRRDKYCDIDYIRKSKVPLIKFHTVEDDIQFDISVNKEDGIKRLWRSNACSISSLSSDTSPWCSSALSRSATWVRHIQADSAASFFSACS